MANLIQATVYQIDGSPLASPITVDFPVNDIIVRKDDTLNIPAVSSAIQLYSSTLNQISYKTYYVSQTVTTLVNLANDTITSFVKVNVLEINGDPVFGGIDYGFPSNQIAVNAAVNPTTGVNATITYRNNTYSVSQTQASILSSSSGYAGVVLNQLDVPSFRSDILANIPAPGQIGRMFVSTDTYALYRDSGVSWDLIGGPGTGTVTGSGSAGQVSFWSGASTIVGNSNLYWDNANVRLGIGTSSPAYKLDVDGTLRSTQGASFATSLGNVQIGTAVDNGYKLYVAGAGYFEDSTRLYKNQNNPTFILISNTNSSSNSETQLVITTDTSSIYLMKYSSTHGAYKMLGANDAILYNNVAGDIGILNDAAAGNIKFAAGGSSTAQMILNTSGNVGIGTNSPASKLALNQTSTGSQKISFTLNNSEYGAIDINTSTGVAEFSSSYQIRITSNSNSTRFSTNGNVSIATTTNNVHRLEVNGTIGNSLTLRQYVIGGGVTAALPTYSFYGDDNNGWYSPSADVQGWTTAGVERMRIDASGRVGIGTTSPGGIGAASLRLDVRGTTWFSADDYGQLEIIPTIGNGGETVIRQYTTAPRNGGDLRIRVDASIQGGNLIIATGNNTERMRVFANGNVGIGTSTDAGFKFDVNGTARINGVLTFGAAPTLESFNGNTMLKLTASLGLTISSDRWNSNTSSSSYIQNGYSTKNFVTTNAANGTFNSFDFSTSNAFQPTIANIYTQKLINGAMTIQSTAVANFFGVDSRTTDNSASIANNVYAIYADATLGTNTSAIRWAGYFVGRGYFSDVVGIGTTSPNASAILDLTSTTKGFLPPRMTGAQAEAIGTPAAGLLVYANNGNGATITSTGWWGYDGTTWVKLN